MEECSFDWNSITHIMAVLLGGIMGYFSNSLSENKAFKQNQKTRVYELFAELEKLFYEEYRLCVKQNENIFYAKMHQRLIELFDQPTTNRDRQAELKKVIDKQSDYLDTNNLKNEEIGKKLIEQDSKIRNIISLLSLYLNFHETDNIFDDLEKVYEFDSDEGINMEIGEHTIENLNEGPYREKIFTDWKNQSKPIVKENFFAICDRITDNLREKINSKY